MTDLRDLADKLDLLADRRAQCASIRLHTGGVAGIVADLRAQADALLVIARTLEVAGALAEHHADDSKHHKEW